MAMTSRSDFSSLVDWQKVESVATLLIETCAATRLPPEREWVLEVVREAAADLSAELIDDLTLTYNKVRQANITREMIEIATGANAL